MPTYDYECEACGHTLELFQRISEDPIKKCPECNKNKLTRLFGTGAAIVFKGSGFYETDYRSDSYKKGAEKAKKSSDDKSKKSDSGSKSSDSSGSSDKSASKSTSSSSSSKSSSSDKSSSGNG